jgi:hypothetical protein
MPMTTNPSSSSYDLVALCRDGFYFCKVCQRIAQVDVDPFLRCARCHSPRVKYCPPVPGFAERSFPLTPHGSLHAPGSPDAGVSAGGVSDFVSTSTTTIDE